MSQFHTRMRRQRSLSGLHHQMIRCIRSERKWRSWWVDGWEWHRGGKVNSVSTRTQRREHDPESIGHCLGGTRGQTK